MDFMSIVESITLSNILATSFFWGPIIILAYWRGWKDGEASRNEN